MTEKKKWQSPELIVLVRGKPEEAVLMGCKDPGFIMFNAPTDLFDMCIDDVGGCLVCDGLITS